MERDYIHISVILDRTGSMEMIRDDTIDGFNMFLWEQQRHQGKGTMTLVQFDSEDPYEVIHWMRPIAEVPPLSRATFVPRATTPLLDALGRGIVDLERALGQLEYSQSPERILIVIITDGQENASREFCKDDIERLIKGKQDLGWQFVFLSADLESFDDAASVGIPQGSRLFYQATSSGTTDAWKALTDATNLYRTGKGKLFQFRRPDDDDSTENPKA